MNRIAGMNVIFITLKVPVPQLQCVTFENKCIYRGIKMESFLLLLAVWVAILCYFAWVIYGRSYSNSIWKVKFKLEASASHAELFSCLLSGNIALIEKDNFDQLASSLPAERVQEALFRYWKIEGPESFSVGLQRAFFQLGDTYLIERQAFGAWNTGFACNTPTYIRLFDVCRFLSVNAALIEPGRIGARQLNMSAWDIQRLAYLVRLGYAAHYMPRDAALQSLRRLSVAARAHYTSWEDFSISALIGMGVRSEVDVLEASVWHGFAQTHVAMTAADGAPFAQVAWAPGVQVPKHAHVARTNALGDARAAVGTSW